MTDNADTLPQLGQGSAGVTDLVTALQGVVRQSAAANANMISLIAAIQSISPSTPMAAIANATNSTDVVTQFNTLLAELRGKGLLAS